MANDFISNSTTNVANQSPKPMHPQEQKAIEPKEKSLSLKMPNWCKS